MSMSFDQAIAPVTAKDFFDHSLGSLTNRSHCKGCYKERQHTTNEEAYYNFWL